MKTVLVKVKSSDLSGYSGPVLLPVCDELDDISYGQEVEATFSFKESAIRTTKQNSAIHLFCKMVAKALNSAGWSMKKYFEVKKMDIDWTPVRVKENIWRPIQVAMFDIESTTKIKKTQVNEVYETINRHHSESLGLDYVPFPSRFGD